MSVFTNPASTSVEQAAAYTTAVLDLLGARDPFDVLRGTVRTLERTLDALSPAQLTEPESPGKWSIRHVLQHLADSELVWAYRLRMVLAHDRPPLTGYDQDLWADRLHYDRADAAQAVRDMAVLRSGNLRLLTGAPPEDFTRVGVHTERGEESVERLVRLYAGHDLLHLRQIDRIRRAIGATAPPPDARLGGS
jgi:uncharacterized damage-inducible protein DinB